MPNEKLSYVDCRNIVESLSMHDFRSRLLRKSGESREFSKLLSSGAHALNTDDRDVVISILTEAMPSLKTNLSDEELDSLGEAIASRSVSLR